MSDAFPAPASRLAPCPCGSGKRYKECHGAIGGPSAAVPSGSAATAAAQRSAYRAPGAEWAGIDPDAQDRLGELMERALAHQVSGRVDDAANDYAAVIAAAPNTHDALHMLGVIELNRRNLIEAERLITLAMALRPRYRAIEHNLQLVVDARDALSRARPDEIAERALPILWDLALAPDAPGRPARAIGTRAAGGHAALHLIGRVHGDDDDDAWLLARLAQLFEPARPQLWSAAGGSHETVAGRAMTRIDASSGTLPRGGVHVFVGLDYDLDAWIGRADADRAIVFCQGATPTRYLDQLRVIARDGARPVELAFAARSLADRFGRGHAVLPPPLDPAEIATAARLVAVRAPTPGTTPVLRVGIAGQSQRRLVQPEDADLVKRLIAAAGHLEIRDPGRYRYLLGGNPAVRFRSRRNTTRAQFVAGLDAWVQRATPWWDETLGRELYLALALGLPVLCARGSVHAELIEHEDDGLLFDDAASLERAIAALRADPARAAELGRRGRAKAAVLLDAGTLAQRYAALFGVVDPRQRGVVVEQAHRVMP